MHVPPLGPTIEPDGVRFAVWSEAATRIWVSLFDANGERETGRIELLRDGDAIHTGFVPGIGAGTLYGLRADGPYDPGAGYWFDPAKLLTDPYAIAIDRPYAYDPRLALPRSDGFDTAPLMPKAIITDLPPPPAHRTPTFKPGGLIYELHVRGFTMRHPDIPEALRGTVAALTEPVVIDHLKRIGVSVVELMPITAWIDERHLEPLGLTNSWGYNPVSFMALDPRLVPGGLAELRTTVAALHEAGIDVIMDVVFNHTGESDIHGPTLSLRGLDARHYFRHLPGRPGALVNDSGCGNTLACDQPAMTRLVLDSLRHFVRHAGIDGYRFDLAPILARGHEGFDVHAFLLHAMDADDILKDRILIAEPWDIGPGGYQLGNFPPHFLEWNDRYRDDARSFWRGDPHAVGDLATRLAGSSDIFGHHREKISRSVNFLAAHDGFTLADTVAYAHKHNEANGEHNRDGHDHNLSWNNGVEGHSDDPAILAARHADLKALLATLYASRGTIMLTAGDEFGRSQQGNNNAYAQDNDISWVDWEGRDRALEDYAAQLADLRAAYPALSRPGFLTPDEVDWLVPDGLPFAENDWHDPATDRIMMLLHDDGLRRIAVAFNRSHEACRFTPPKREGHGWLSALPSFRRRPESIPPELSEFRASETMDSGLRRNDGGLVGTPSPAPFVSSAIETHDEPMSTENAFLIPPRSVGFFIECKENDDAA